MNRVLDKLLVSFNREAFILVILGIFVILSGCGSKTMMTAREANCSVRDVEIIPSEFDRSGSTSNWCARCDGKTMWCTSNADRSRITCREVPAGELPCR